MSICIVQKSVASSVVLVCKLVWVLMELCLFHELVEDDTFKIFITIDIRAIKQEGFHFFFFYFFGTGHITEVFQVKGTMFSSRDHMNNWLKATESWEVHDFKSLPQILSGPSVVAWLRVLSSQSCDPHLSHLSGNLKQQLICWLILIINWTQRQME